MSVNASRIAKLSSFKAIVKHMKADLDTFDNALHHFHKSENRHRWIDEFKSKYPSFVIALRIYYECMRSYKNCIYYLLRSQNWIRQHMSHSICQLEHFTGVYEHNVESCGFRGQF